MPVPNASFAPADTVYGVVSYIEFTPAGVGAVAVAARCKMLDADAQNEIKFRKVPDAAGVLRKDRAVRAEAGEEFTFEIEELKKGSQFLLAAGTTLNGFARGTATIWITDPDDAANKAKLKSEAFPCCLVRDGSVAFKDDFSMMKIKITSLKAGDVTFTYDGNA